MSLFRLPDEEPLAEVDAALAARLRALLLQTLQDELTTPEPEALRLADDVTWTVTRERDGMWLTLTRGTQNAIGIGGDWRRDDDGLTLYVRQLAYELVGREREFEP